MRALKYFSLFSGIGGFEIGIQKAYVDTINRSKNRGSKSSKKKDDAIGQGLESETGQGTRATNRRAGQHNINGSDSVQPACVGYSEIDPYAIAIYKNHYPTHKNYGDITKIKAKELPEFDLIVGGFPCQSFSIAGKRGGFADTRGTLFFDIARIIKAKQPRLLLLENVKGLLSHDKGNTFRTIIATLDELGYDLEWQIVNSKNHGVPQNRERVLIVGHLRGTPRPKVFPFQREIERATDHLFYDESQVRREGKLREYKGQSPTLNTAGGGGHIPLVIQRKRGKNKGGAHTIAPTISSNSYQDNNHLAIAKTVRVSGRGSPFDSKQNWDTYKIGGRLRRLTPLECERLQAYPDHWTALGSFYNSELDAHVVRIVSDAQRYKTLGNGITTNVVKDVIRAILAQ